MAFCLVLAGVVAAEEADARLPDPTLPDLGLGYVQPEEQGLGGETETPLSALELEYTLISPSRRVAMISGKAVQEGERIEDAKIIKIRPEQVTIRREGKLVVLDLVGYREKIEEPEGASEASVDSTQDTSGNAAKDTSKKGAKNGDKDGAK